MVGVIVNCYSPSDFGLFVSALLRNGRSKRLGGVWSADEGSRCVCHHAYKTLNMNQIQKTRNVVISIPSCIPNISKGQPARISWSATSRINCNSSTKRCLEIMSKSYGTIGHSSTKSWTRKRDDPSTELPILWVLRFQSNLFCFSNHWWLPPTFFLRSEWMQLVAPLALTMAAKLE